MYFLGPISWILGKVADGAMATFGALFRWLAFWINELLYTMISNLYDVFIALCNGQLLDNDTLNGLFGRVGMLLGVVMMLRVAFSFIQMLIDPDSFSDKEKGLSKIVTKIIIVICMFGISGYVFEFLRDVQGEIIESNAIAKFFIPVQVNTEDFGGALSAELFTAFYNLDPDIDYSNDTTGCGDERFITTAKNRIIRDNDYSYARSCLLEKGTIQETGDEEYYINFNWIFSTVVAIFTLFFLLNYCISVGVRIVQLAVLQIISPMAIIGYLSPKSDNMFTRWGKLYISTYIDVFIRIAIINLVVYLCGVIMENWYEGNGVFWSSVGAPEGVTRVLIGVMMIMALLSFAKKAPELMKQLLPQGFGSGIGFGMKNEGANAFIGGLTGAAVGAIGGVAGGKGLSRLTGLASGIGFGALRGGKAGFGSNGVGSALSGATSAQSKANLSRAQAIGAGIGLRERLANRTRDLLGIEAGSATDEREISALSDYAKMQDTMEGYADKVSTIKQLKRDYENIQQSGRQKIDTGQRDNNNNIIYRDETDAEMNARIKDARKRWTDARESFISASMQMQAGQDGYYEVDGVRTRIDSNDGLAANIRAATSEMDRIANEHKNVFRGFEKVTDYNSLENVTAKANGVIADRRSKQRRKSG